MGNDKIPANWGAYVDASREAMLSNKISVDDMMEAYCKANIQALQDSQCTVAVAFLTALTVPTGPERDRLVDAAQVLSAKHADKFGERLEVAFQWVRRGI